MIGKKLSDRYEVLDRVGGGGMAIVYKAKDILLDRVVAVKILRSQYATDEDFVYRFRREGQAAASLSHPNIVSIYDVGVEEDIHYMVMEYVDGQTLKAYIENHAPLMVEEAINFTTQIAEALDQAHQNQIIHRDIKPHNILISKNGGVKVTDFGIARAATSATITQTGSVIGSVHYFSPEQARGGMTGEKSDIYSLGIVLYEMVTGTLPFSGDSPISVALKHLQETFTDPKQLNPDIPQSVENIITRSLSKDPLKRYGSARELMEDLETCLLPGRLSEEKYVQESVDEDTTKVIPAINEDLVDTKVAQPQTDSDEEPPQKKKRSVWFRLALLTLITLLLGFGTYQGYQFVSQVFYVQEVELEDVRNLPVEEAIAKLQTLGLQVDTSERHHDEVEEGHVIHQIPVPGSMVKEDSEVRLTVSLGKEETEMIALVDLPLQTAERLLENNQFHPNITIEEEYNDEVEEGYIISQYPEENQLIVPDETEVTLVVSMGKEMISMPNLTGLTEAEAEATLLRNHLILEGVETDRSDRTEGEVFRQEPIQPEQEVEVGTPIRIWVSEGYEEEFREITEEITVRVDDDDTEDEEDQNEAENGNEDAENGEETENEDNSSVQVSIFVTDVDKDEQIINEQISEDQTYSVTVKVSREQRGTIKVFRDGALYYDESFSFE